jgi:hypothetical protein
METMGDILERARDFASASFSKDEAERLFGWKVESLDVKMPEEHKATVVVTFENKIILDIKYFLHPELKELGDEVDIKVSLKTDLVSRVRYNIFYSGYIHGQGYMRVDMGEVENPMMQRMYEDYYLPALKMIYRPIIIQFKGFFTRDFFGVRADSRGGEIYYSPVSTRSESKDAKVWDVIGRLHDLDVMLRSPEVVHSLAELDVQMSFLPSVIWS